MDSYNDEPGHLINKLSVDDLDEGYPHDLAALLAALPSNNNPQGHNGKRPSPAPTEWLGHVLGAYYKEGMSDWQAINERLAREHGESFRFGRMSFFQATKRLNVGTSRKTKYSLEEVAMSITQEMDKDVMDVVGIRAMKHKMLLKGILIPRSQIHEAMKKWNPSGLASRRPGTRKIVRSPIVSIGPNEQWSIDGHDKLAKFGIGIYGIRDVYSGRMLALRAMPCNRRKEDVHLVYLETVEEAGGFPLQIASDRGSEILEVVATQIAFRTTYSDPKLAAKLPFKLLKSTHNITIERSWRNIRENVVDPVKVHINEAHAKGLVDMSDPVQSTLVDWIIPPLVQSLLDDYKVFFNSFTVRFQRSKVNPSGAPRNEIYFNPGRWGGEECLQRFPTEDAISKLKEIAVEKAQMSWLTPEAITICQRGCSSISATYPATTWEGAWSLIQALRPLVDQDLDDLWASEL